MLDYLKSFHNINTYLILSIILLFLVLALDYF
ncbi:hypothetical protein ABIC56_003171 [Acinetobacter bereziniae]|uniref:Uncharacterized protein n=1 Tax=Acinetobacter bereziniae NIPH 3 TaxID=1217651 RepID=N8YKL3_ACIBZ|nr:hypothetical protein F963_02262 [Acinetobacter bereziniae NIPH 3]MDR6543110.1 hypothetical protein [Acinetobacter bereziniae]